MRDPGGISQESSNEKSAFARFKGNRIAVSRKRKTEKEGEKEMKKFNFKKLGILLVMMLAGALVLVGPASAWNEEHELSNKGLYDVWAGGTLLWGGEGVNGYGQAGTVSGADADCIFVMVELYHAGSTLLALEQEGELDTDFFEVPLLYDHHAVMSNPYLLVTMSGSLPTDWNDGLVCYPTP